MYTYKKDCPKQHVPVIQGMWGRTRSGGASPPPTHSYNTRSAARAGGSPAQVSRPFVPPVDTSTYSNGTRPSFTSTTISTLYAMPTLVGTVNCYNCKTSSTTSNLLPRFGDATPAQISAGNYATIGHIVQWQDYIARHCNPRRGTWHGYTYEAYLLSDVRTYYNDISNLELQSQHYNSQIAYSYPGTSPLIPIWI